MKDKEKNPGHIDDSDDFGWVDRAVAAKKKKAARRTILVKKVGGVTKRKSRGSRRLASAR